jgi:glycosyltransferase involved in cell wall biosynthesis
VNDRLISVIIPVFNGAGYLSEAIESVLSQCYTPVEIIVVDDGSTDGSDRIARGLSDSVRIFRQPNSGTAAARNQGVRMAQGAFLAFLDQDDLWTGNKLSLQIAAFEQSPGPDLVFGYVKQFHSPELDESSKSRILCPPSPMPGYSPSAMLVKRETFFRVGLFGTSWQIGEWADWYARAIDLNLRVKMLPDVVARRRLHDRNKGVVQRSLITEYARILKASLDRRARE